MLLHRFMQAEQADSYLDAINLIVAGQLGYLTSEAERESTQPITFPDPGQFRELGQEGEATGFQVPGCL